MNKTVKIPRHTWMNTHNKSNQICTRCGLKKENLGPKGVRYIKDGIETMSIAPKCILNEY